MEMGAVSFIVGVTPPSSHKVDNWRLFRSPKDRSFLAVWRIHNGHLAYTRRLMFSVTWTLTVVDGQVDGSVDFFKNFSSYENGFGSLHGDFWLGLRYLNEMSSRRNNTLRIELRTPNATRLYDVYEEFMGSTYLFSPYHDGMAFTTYDHDMDQSSVSNCANDYHGAWWYKSCYSANLNGQYFVPGTHNGTGITYNSFKFLISLKESKMMFK
ncbi:FCN1-like protein [Mya arenaria]|uniref:FCN1-like protein n=1 Tax=Mya arenaria TaxID=6604 RepID=A0ABY7GAB0_MYAAR|nr:FCN1-like protein [Mya arenaria]